MAVKSRTALGRVEFKSRAKFKTTSQGNSVRSRPKNRKKSRGQGK